MTSLNNENWTILRKYMIDNKDDISKINFYYLSTSLVAAASPLMLTFPFLNLFHTAVGMQLIGKNGKIKRSGIFQLIETLSERIIYTIKFVEKPNT